jgi:2-keto-4-pentenoate hydratase/2-oxohepta-3-ene-1,7-dioic acid hydratase (catechol pathway)
MKIYRYREGNDVRFAVATDGRLRRSAARDLFSAASGGNSGEEVSLESLALLTPSDPSKIVCVGRNYAEHAKELGNEAPPEPILFLKPPSALLAPEGVVEMPPESQRVDYEGELGIVIGKRARRISAARWREVVLGFTCGDDVTARDLQKKDVQFTRGKSFDTFAPIGPCIETDLDVSDIAIITRVNGEIRQNGRTSQMIFSPAQLVAFISNVMTLEPGDVILTGTPAGVGPVNDGDVVEVEIEGIGILRNRMAAAR